MTLKFLLLKTKMFRFISTKVFHKFDRIFDFLMQDLPGIYILIILLQKNPRGNQFPTRE